MNQSTINFRISQLIESFRLNPNSLAVKLGTSDTVIRRILNGTNKPGYDTLNKIIQTFEGLNVHWLMTGEGPMLLPEDQIEIKDHQTGTNGVNYYKTIDGEIFVEESDFAIYTSKVMLLEDRIRDLEDRIRDKEELISLLKEKIAKYENRGGAQDKSKPDSEAFGT